MSTPETCAICKHAMPVDPAGHWRAWGGGKFADTHIHCPYYNEAQHWPRYSAATVIPLTSECVMEPSKWEGL